MTEQTYGAHPHGGLTHVHNYREGDGHDHRPTTVPLRSDPRYLREFCAWAEGQYPQGTPGHAAVLAVLKGPHGKGIFESDSLAEAEAAFEAACERLREGV